MPFYAVRKGRTPGVYQTWPECQEQILKFTGAKYKKFSTEDEALSFVQEQGSSAGPTVSPGAQGKKRSLSPDTGPQPPKKPDLKKDKSAGENVDYWTGEKFNEKEGVIVYTDGACGFHGKNGAQAGLGVYFGPGDSRNLSERLTGKPTNKRAEIHAARRAVEQAKADGIENLILYTDSQFLINSITTWIKGWKKKDWVKATGEPVINKEDFLHLDSVIKDINIKWVHVKGHDGKAGKEGADKLASEGSKKSLPTA